MIDTISTLTDALSERRGGLASPSNSNRLLPVVLVAAFGRSGTTSLMALLGTNPQVLMGSAYPFEHRYLTYLAKLHLSLDRRVRAAHLRSEAVCEFENDDLGGDCWKKMPGPKALDARLPQFQNPHDRLRNDWQAVSDDLRATLSSAALYAEKVPAWMPALLRELVPTQVLYLFRDPRDVYLSANAFMARMNYFSFSRGPADDDLSHARNLAYEYWYYYDNYLGDCRRPDVLRIEYAELIEGLTPLAKRLSRFLGIELSSQLPDIGHHRTAASSRASVGRWRDEPWNPEVLSLLEQTLSEPMQELGYKPSTNVVAPALPLVDFTREQDRRLQLTTSPDGTLAPKADDGLWCRITGDDFYVLLPWEPFDAAAVHEIWVGISCDVDHVCSLYWHGPQSDFAEEAALHIPCHGGAHRRILRFAVGEHPQWTGNIMRLRLDLFNHPRSLEMTRSHVRWVRCIA